MDKKPKSKGAPQLIDVRALLNKLDFSPDNVIAAAAENSVLFVDAADYRLERMRSRNAAKMNWERTKAETGLRIRRDARLSGDKITEGYIEATVLLDPLVTKTAKIFNHAEELDEYSKLVVEAFRMRRDCLQIVKALVSDELGMQRALEAHAEKMRAAREQLRQKFPGDEEA